MASFLNLNFVEVSNTTQGLFLIFLATLANFVGETMGCRVQQLLSNNMAAKHIVLYLLIYFTLNYSSKESSSPMKQLTMSLAIYVFYVMLTRTPFNFTIAIFLCLTVMLFLQNFRGHYASDDPAKKDDDNVKLIDRVSEVGTILSVGLTLVGFLVYYMKQVKDKGDAFDFSKFIFGVTQCTSSTTPGIPSST